MAQDRLKYTDLTPEPDAAPLRVDVCMIRIRPEEHDWVAGALRSVQEQSYPHLGLLVVDNEDRSLSIGQGWNACVQASDADLLLFVGDDDALAPDLVSGMVSCYRHMQRTAPNLVRVTTNCTVLDDDTGLSAIVPGLHHTGMFLRRYLLDHPFDEELARGVGRSMAHSMDQAQRLLGQPLSVAMMHHAGYIYRQHAFMASGNRIEVRLGHPNAAPHAHGHR